MNVFERKRMKSARAFIDRSRDKPHQPPRCRGGFHWHSFSSDSFHSVHATLSLVTTIVLKRMGDRENNRYSLTDDKISDYCPVNVINNFEDRYLRDVAIEHNGFLKDELDALRNYQLEGTESELHKCVAKPFTKAGLLLCENGKWAKFYCETILTSGSFPRIRQCRSSCCVPVP